MQRKSWVPWLGAECSFLCRRWSAGNAQVLWESGFAQRHSQVCRTNLSWSQAHPKHHTHTQSECLGKVFCPLWAPKGTSVWAHQEINLVSVFDPAESSATEGLEREIWWWSAGACCWEMKFSLHFLSDCRHIWAVHFWCFSQSCKHLDKANCEIKIGSYKTAFLTKRFFISFPECFWITPFSWLIPRESLQWCSSGSLKHYKYPI